MFTLHLIDFIISVICTLMFQASILMSWHIDADILKLTIFLISISPFNFLFSFGNGIAFCIKNTFKALEFGQN